MFQNTRKNFTLRYFAHLLLGKNIDIYRLRNSIIIGNSIKLDINYPSKDRFKNNVLFKSESTS